MENNPSTPTRITVACLTCRARRVKCNGQKPVCQACTASTRTCNWPQGRKRKRTKLEMQAAREAEVAAGLRSPGPTPGNAPNAVTEEQLHAHPAVPAVTAALAGQPMSAGPGPSTSTTLLVPAAAQPGVLSASTYSAAGTAALAPSTSSPAVATASTANFGFNTGIPPLVEADPTGTRTAFLRGQPGQDADLELYYYRSAGATAIQPGIHRITLRHQSRDLNNIFPHPTKQYAGPPPVSPSAEFLSLFDQDGSPFPHVWEPLFDIFLKHFVQFFPSISKQRMIDRIESGTMSRFLSVCICAMTARHAEAAVDGPIRFCEPFIAKAQEVGTPLLQLPATDTCTALMFLSWAYYGQGSDSGIWQYAGMAIRMGVDIGIHEVSEIYVSPAHLVRTRLLWWSLYITDRIVSFSTGRPTSIADETIELPFPEDTDFFPDPARDTATDSIEPIEPVPFVYLTRLMVLVGRISNILNVRRGSTFHLANPNQPPAYDLKELQANVMTFLRELPKSLQWSIDNLRHQKERGHGSAFLTMHVWGLAVLTFLNHTGALQSSPASNTSVPPALNRSLAIATARQICEYISVADAVSPMTYTVTPYAVQPLFIAGMSLAWETSVPVEVDHSEDIHNHFMRSIAHQGVVSMLNALSRIKRYYVAAGVTEKLLERRSGVSRSEGTTDISPSIPLPDNGLLRRFTISSRDLAPPTDTSYGEYMAQASSLPGAASTWFNDLWRTYEMDNLSFFPDDVFNLDGLSYQS